MVLAVLTHYAIAWFIVNPRRPLEGAAGFPSHLPEPHRLA